MPFMKASVEVAEIARLSSDGIKSAGLVWVVVITSSRTYLGRGGQPEAFYKFEVTVN